MALLCCPSCGIPWNMHRLLFIVIGSAVTLSWDGLNSTYWLMAFSRSYDGQRLSPPFKKGLNLNQWDVFAKRQVVRQSIKSGPFQWSLSCFSLLNISRMCKK